MIKVYGLQEARQKVVDIERRMRDLSPVWEDVVQIIREGLEAQLNESRGPDGTGFKSLKTSTLRRPRRSPRPYDTIQHVTWDEVVRGGKVVMESDQLWIHIETTGLKYQLDNFPLGMSEDIKTKVKGRIKTYLETGA